MNMRNTLALREIDRIDHDDIQRVETADTVDIDQMQPGLVVPEDLDQRIDDACERIAPLWPLKNFVAVNPFFGLRHLTFQQASDTLARIAGSKLYMDWSYYRELINDGRIARADIAQAIERCGSGIDVPTVEWTVNAKPPRPNLGMASVAEVLQRVDGGIWTSFVTERISLHCAAYFDLGQAMIKMPWRDDSLFQAWRKAAEIDKSPAMMGLENFGKKVAELPLQPRDVIAWAVSRLEIPEAAIERYLHASLLAVGGWAAWARYLRWQADLAGESDDSIVDLLAIKLAWDILLFNEKRSASLVARWREMLAESMRPPSAKRQAAAEIDRILLNATEIALQRNIINGITASTTRNDHRPGRQTRLALQAAFCIDVRSEVFRRSLETVCPGVQTIGFAGFFGVPIEYVPLGSLQARSHVPVIFNPAYRIEEQVDTADSHQTRQLTEIRRERIGLFKAWKGFKFSASSCFSFVEAAGITYAPKLVSDSFGWTRPVPDPVTQGLHARLAQNLGPTLDGKTTDSCCGSAIPVGIPQQDQVDLAERILRAMSLTDNFARLVMLAGHGSSSVNNPHATSLDCGACAGQTGEASARVVATLLNQQNVRSGLRARGIDIPRDTWFVPALHDTTSDDVKLFDTDEVPATLKEDLVQLQQWLEQAGDLTRMQRAGMLGLGGKPDRDIAIDVRRRGNDWSQVRPEWALVKNAAFIAAPRHRSAGIDLEGRAFLHEYNWHTDNGFKILELIMTAPMMVANWINMQYYGSVVDNLRFGSGNKVLHNIVGGAIGVLEGNGGDLRVGLPMQSLHDGKHWVHEPLRLSVFIEAPEKAIEEVIAKHQTVRELVDNGWLHLFQIQQDGSVNRRLQAFRWERCGD